MHSRLFWIIVHLFTDSTHKPQIVRTSNLPAPLPLRALSSESCRFLGVTFLSQALGNASSFLCLERLFSSRCFMFTRVAVPAPSGNCPGDPAST